MDLSNANVILIGDSISKGLYLDNFCIKKLKNNAVKNVEQALNIDIQNLSVFGQTLNRAVNKGIFDKVASMFDKNKQNIAVIELGGNDADYNWAEVSKKPLFEHSPKTPLAEFEKLARNTIIYLKSLGFEVVVLSLFPINSGRYFNNVVAKQGDKQNILKFLKGDESNLYRHQESYNNCLAKIAKKLNCDFIDYRTPILLERDFLSYLCDDGIHPNDKGQEFIANYIEKKAREKSNFLAQSNQVAL